jgi:hypothetical protein
MNTDRIVFWLHHHKSMVGVVVDLEQQALLR